MRFRRRAPTRIRGGGKTGETAAAHDDANALVVVNFFPCAKYAFNNSVNKSNSARRLCIADELDRS